VTTSTTFYHAGSSSEDRCALRKQDHHHARRTNLALSAQRVTARQLCALQRSANLVLFTLLASVCRRGQTTQ